MFFYHFFNIFSFFRKNRSMYILFPDDAHLFTAILQSCYSSFRRDIAFANCSLPDVLKQQNK